MPLLYATNHPIYQELLLNDLINRHRVPGSTLKLIDETSTMSRTGQEGRYQSGDDELEEINKNWKKWTVGVPSQTQWKKLFRNLDKMETLCNKALGDAGNTDPPSKHNEGKASLANEVNAIRALIRILPLQNIIVLRVITK